MGRMPPMSSPITIANNTDVMAGGIAPRPKLRGRRATRANPRINSTKPLTASDTGFAILRG